MTERSAESVALDFVARINAREVDAIAELMTANHVFIDMENGRSEGRDAMCKGWRGYYSLFPDYRIHIDHTFDAGDHVVLIGHSTGTLSEHGRSALVQDGGFSEDALQGPALWTAKVVRGHVAEWRVYTDSIKVRNMLGVDAVDR